MSFTSCKTFEIGHFRRVAGFDQSLEPLRIEFHETAAERHLLAEKIGLAFFPKVVSIMPARPPPIAEA